ncbi:MAG TPA: 4-carboxymuconolactone decarboxylase [Paracoccaceae bacterium]|nr:4-carboxymuconolactone decarboxylase [Paracoccaceae bacterium]
MGADRTRHETGMAVRREVLGEAHVARAEASKSDFDADFQAFIAEGAWGSVWARPDISRRERSMVTVAILAALGRDEELALHLRATARTGASREDIRETLMHVGVYAGVPAANSAFRIAKRVFAEIDAEAAGTEP